MPLTNPVLAKTFQIPLHSDDAQALLRKIATYLAGIYGVYGVSNVTGAGTFTGPYAAFNALTSSTLTLTYQDGTSATLTVPAGSTVYGNITSASVASGTGVLYKAGR